MVTVRFASVVPLGPSARGGDEWASPSERGPIARITPWL